MTVKLRSLTRADIYRLDELWRAHWASSGSLPGLNNRVIDALAVDEDDRIIGYGQVHLFAEAMLFLDPTARARDRANALKLLMTEALRGTRAAGIEQIYAHMKDPQFSLLIQNRYGFESCRDTGKLFMKDLGD